jgi:SAM-dependent methyltransferase
MAPPVPEPVTFLADRGPDVHRVVPWSPFAHVAKELRALVAAFVEAAALPPGASVLDYGAADSPYRDLFPGADYRAADLPGNRAADVALRPDGTVPLGDGTVDLVLSTQVLEHVADPELYLRECARVLRPGGQLVLTTHGIMFLHRDPTDYWRWTSDGLRLVIERAGLEVVEVRGVLGLVGAALQLLQTGIARRLPRRLVKPVVVVFQVLIRVADRTTSDVARVENGLVLGVRARRPTARA